MSQPSKKPGYGRRVISRNVGVREEIIATANACETSISQFRDDLVLREIELALEIMSVTVEKFGRIWLCGNGAGFCLAAEICHRLTTSNSRYERPTRASVLGLNGATSTTDHGKCGIEDALSAELIVNGRDADVLWCFAADPCSQLTLGASSTAFQELKIPVIVFTSYPGTPITRFSNAKIRIQAADERDQAGYCVQWAHGFLANVMANQLKRLSRRSRL